MHTSSRLQRHRQDIDRGVWGGGRVWGGWAGGGWGGGRGVEVTSWGSGERFKPPSRVAGEDELQQNDSRDS